MSGNLHAVTDTQPKRILKVLKMESVEMYENVSEGFADPREKISFEETAIDNKNDSDDDKGFDGHQFFRESALKKLLKITCSTDPGERIVQAQRFCKKVIRMDGDINEIDTFIKMDVYRYFCINKTEAALVDKSYNSELKTRRKSQDARDKKKRHEAVVKQRSKNGEGNGLGIPEEFNGLYETKMNPFTETEEVIPCPDRIAAHIVRNTHMITYKENVYCYDQDAGYFRESATEADKEATRIMCGILPGTKSNGISHRIPDITQIYKHLNRVNDFPFTNTHKVLPFKNCVVKINDEYEIEVLENDYKKYVLNYVFPMVYDPTAPTEPVITELEKYVDDPRVILQMFAQILAQTLVDQPYRKGYFLYGDKKYGKTFIGVELLQKRFLSSCFVSGIPLNRLSEETDNKFTLSELEGKLANIKDEMSYFNLKDANTYKALMGSFIIRKESKGKDGFLARSTAIHVFIANRLAEVADKVWTDDAFWERVQPVNFNKTKFDLDPTAADMIFTEKFMSGLLNLVLDTLKIMIKTKKLIINREWEEVRDEWSQNSEPMYRFIVENMERATSRAEYTAIRKYDLLKSTQAWYDDNLLDQKHRPETTGDLVGAVRMCGGALDKKRTFIVDKWDTVAESYVYKTSPTSHMPILDGDGKRIRETVEKKTRCYVLPWKWKAGNKYRRYTKEAKAIDTENAELDDFDEFDNEVE
jgi:hypothetical protein